MMDQLIRRSSMI